MTGASVRIVVMIGADPSRWSPRQFRSHARHAWREAIMRSHSRGRIELAAAEELIRAWPDAESRR